MARAEGQSHVAGCTGSTSERVVQGLHGLPDFAMLDMGDFVGGMLKYLRKEPRRQSDDRRRVCQDGKARSRSDGFAFGPQPGRF